MQLSWSARLLGGIFGRITHAIVLITYVGAMQLQDHAAAALPRKTLRTFYVFSESRQNVRICWIENFALKLHF